MAFTSEHDLPQFSDPAFPNLYGEEVLFDDFDEDEAVLFCAACQDTEVYHEGDVCQACRESDPSDWVLTGGYEEMRKLARLSDEIAARKQVA